MTVTDVPRITRKNTYDRYGTTGLPRASGVVIDEPVPSLRGSRGRKIFAQMATDPVVSAFLFAIEKVIAQLVWRVDPADDTPEAEEIAEFVQSCIDDMDVSWDTTLGEIMTMLIYGWSLTEIVYKRRLGEQDESNPAAPASSAYDDGKIGWSGWEPRNQDTLYDWVIDENDRVRGMRQSDPWSARPVSVIPEPKFLLWRTTVRRANPEGLSLLRGAHRSWFFKTRIEEIEAIGVERDLAGLPVAWVDPAYLDPNAPPAMQSVLSTIEDIVQGIKRNEEEGVVFPLAYDDAGNRIMDLTLLSTGGQRQFDTDSVIGRYDQRIAVSVLADWLLLGHEKVGSYSLGTTKMNLWTMAVDAIAGAIRDVVNAKAIPRLLRLNGIKPDEPPRVDYGDVSEIDLSVLAEYLSKLVAAGILTADDRLEEYIRKVGGLPTAENEHAHEDAAEMAEADKEAFLANLQGTGKDTGEEEETEGGSEED